MASWKLIVENYGKIKSAEIEVAPLTLFVGDNNSGKSYLLSLLWGIKQYGVEGLIGNKLVNSDEAKKIVEWVCKQIETVKERKKIEVSLGEISIPLQKFLNDEIKRNKNKLVRQIFNSSNIDIERMEIKLFGVEKTFLHIDATEGKMIRLSGKKGDAFGFDETMFDDILNEGDKIFHWYLVAVIYSIVLNIAFNKTPIMSMGRCTYLPAARTGFMLTKDIINKVGRKNTFNLPDQEEQITPFISPINQFLDIMSDLSLEKKGKIKHMKLALDIEKEMSDGIIEISSMPNKEVQYVPTGYKNGIPLRLSSAVVTELSPLVLMLKHHGNLQEIYYEEPEMCLHPQLQSKMGKMIGRMVNIGIGMVITTHSDIMFQHINNMIKLTKRPDYQEICEQLGYTELDLLKPEQVKVYQLRAKKKGKTEVEELICGENGFVVHTFNDALDNIMNEAYEIQG